MDKSLLKYETQEEVNARTDEIMKTWQGVDYENYIFSAKHPSGCHLVVNEETENIEVVNWAEWVRHLCNDEGLSAVEVSKFQERIKKEFTRWVEVTDEQLMQQHSGQNIHGMSLRDVVSKQKQKS